MREGASERARVSEWVVGGVGRGGLVGVGWVELSIG